MSVRQSLCAILTLGPCYGYQLRAEYARRTGAARTLNVGQIYNTLERLERDGLVETGETDAQGHVYYSVTDAGRSETTRWFATASPNLDLDELAAKVALAATLPGTDTGAVIAAERAATHTPPPPGDDGDPKGSERLARELAHAAIATAVQARRDWLDAAERMLRQHPVEAVPLAPSRPRRGRPTRVA